MPSYGLTECSIPPIKREGCANQPLSRSRFATVALAVKARKENLTTLTADQAAFKAQKDLPTGKKTFKAYLWKVCGEAYDAQYGG